MPTSDSIPTIPLASAQPSCYDCIYAFIEPGFVSTREDPGEPAGAFCGHDLYQDAQEDEARALECPGFIARMAERCQACNREMHVPLHLLHNALKITGEDTDTIPVCSMDCLDVLIDRIRDEDYESQMAWLDSDFPYLPESLEGLE